MTKRVWWKAAWVALAAGSTLLIPSGCLTSTVQRIVVAVAFD